MVIFQYNLYIFGIHLWTVLYPKPCYNELCYKEVVVYHGQRVSLSCYYSVVAVLMLRGMDTLWGETELLLFLFWKAGLSGSVGCTSNWWSGGCGFDPHHMGNIFVSWRFGHKIFSTVILSLPLIQEGQLSASGERTCTILVNRLEN